MLLSFVNSSRYVVKKHTVGKILARKRGQATFCLMASRL